MCRLSSNQNNPPFMCSSFKGKSKKLAGLRRARRAKKSFKCAELNIRPVHSGISAWITLLISEMLRLLNTLSARSQVRRAFSALVSRPDRNEPKWTIKDNFPRFAKSGLNTSNVRIAVGRTFTWPACRFLSLWRHCAVKFILVALHSLVVIRQNCSYSIFHFSALLFHPSDWQICQKLWKCLAGDTDLDEVRRGKKKSSFYWKSAECNTSYIPHVFRVNNIISLSVLLTPTCTSLFGWLSLQPRDKVSYGTTPAPIYCWTNQAGVEVVLHGSAARILLHITYTVRWCSQLQSC